MKVIKEYKVEKRMKDGQNFVQNKITLKTREKKSYIQRERDRENEILFCLLFFLFLMSKIFIDSKLFVSAFLFLAPAIHEDTYRLFVFSGKNYFDQSATFEKRKEKTKQKNIGSGEKGITYFFVSGSWHADI